MVASEQTLFNMELGLTAFQFRFSTDYGKLMAGSVLSVLPMLVIFVILRRRIIESVAPTGMKGDGGFAPPKVVPCSELETWNRCFAFMTDHSGVRQLPASLPGCLRSDRAVDQRDQGR